MRDKGKRGGIFYYLAQVRFQVCFLQEVHLKDGGDVRIFSEGWKRGDTRWVVVGVHSSGLGILFGERDFHVSGSFSVVQGRALVVDADWRGVYFRFINVYAPAEPQGRRDLFLALPDVCVTNRVLVVGGDFNISFEGNGDFSLPYLRDVVVDFNLQDGFRAVDKVGEGFTWSKTRGAHSRMDFVFLPSTLEVNDAAVSPLWFTDHGQLRVTFGVEAPLFGRGYWRLNCEILKEKVFWESFSFHYGVWEQLKPCFGTLVEWWEGVKRNTRLLAIVYSTAKARERRKEFVNLQERLQVLVTAGNKGEEVDREALEEVKDKLGVYFRERARVFLYRCRKEKFELGERCSKYFFKQIKTAQARACIPQLRGKGGGLVTDPQEMAEVASLFFGEVFGEGVVGMDGLGRFLGSLQGRVPGGVMEGMESPVTKEEVEEAMMGLPAGKVPGIDGLPKEFFLTFWGILGRDV